MTRPTDESRTETQSEIIVTQTELHHDEQDTGTRLVAPGNLGS
jgi:hypothetical protein